MIKRIKSIFTDNIVIKVFALLFAILLWMHAITRSESEVNFVVPLELRDIPAGMMLAGDVPGFVDVRIKGNESFIKGLSSREIHAVVSLKGAKKGESLHILSAKNIKTPGRVEVSRVSPVEVRLILDDAVRKMLEVRPSLDGRPAAGYVVKGAKAEPAKVAVSGPRSLLEKLDVVYTETVDVTGMNKDTDREADIALNEMGGIHLETGRVLLHIDVIKMAQ